MPSSPLLELDHASVLRGPRTVLDDISLRIDEGEHTAILGPNGSGKSSLAGLLSRNFYPLARADGRASVRVFGRERWAVDELRGLLGIVSPALQNDFALDEPVSAGEAVLAGFFAARALGLDHRVTPAMRERAQAVLTALGVEHLRERPLASLSTGEARRVLIARALVHGPRALLLDEPCTGLDPAARRQFLESLRELARGGTTLILITHHVEEVLPEIGRVILLDQGKIRADGAKAELLADAPLSALFGVPMRIERRDPWYSAALA